MTDLTQLAKKLHCLTHLNNFCTNLTPACQINGKCTSKVAILKKILKFRTSVPECYKRRFQIEKML